jgi:hypothetical protein
MQKNTLLGIIVFLLLVAIIPPIAAEGNITVAERSDYSYYLGKALTFTGNNSLTETTYIYVIGMGDGPAQPSTLARVISGDASTFDKVSVGADGKWKYTWDTGNVLDQKKSPGSYYVVFTTEPTVFNEKSSACTGSYYSSPSCERSGVLLTLKNPYAKFDIKTTTIEKGRSVSGIAEGRPSEVAVWIIMGSNVDRLLLPVNSDSSVSIDTKLWKNGQYTLVLQHPMGDKQFAVSDVGGRTGDAATEYLINALKPDTIDDDFAITHITIIDPTPTRSSSPTPTPTPNYDAKIANLESTVAKQNETIANISTAIKKTPKPTATINYSATIAALQKQIEAEEAKNKEQDDFISQILKFLGLS